MVNEEDKKTYMDTSRGAERAKQRDSLVLLTFRLSAMWQTKSHSLRAEAFKQSSLYNDQPPFVWTQYLSSTHATSGVFCILHLLASPDIPNSSRKKHSDHTSRVKYIWFVTRKESGGKFKVGPYEEYDFMRNNKRVIIYLYQ